MADASRGGEQWREQGGSDGQGLSRTALRSVARLAGRQPSPLGRESRRWSIWVWPAIGRSRIWQERPRCRKYDRVSSRDLARPSGTAKVYKCRRPHRVRTTSLPHPRTSPYPPPRHSNDHRRSTSPHCGTDPHLGSLHRILAPLRPVWPLERSTQQSRNLPVYPSSYVSFFLLVFVAQLIYPSFRPHNTYH